MIFLNPVAWYISNLSTEERVRQFSRRVLWHFLIFGAIAHVVSVAVFLSGHKRIIFVDVIIFILNIASILLVIDALRKSMLSLSAVSFSMKAVFLIFFLQAAIVSFYRGVPSISVLVINLLIFAFVFGIPLSEYLKKLKEFSNSEVKSE